MVAPYAKIKEQDESNYINTERSVNVFVASWAPCGPVGTRLVTNSKRFYQTYSTENKYKSGYPVAFLSAEAVFKMNSPVYFCRVVPEDALYGGAVVRVGGGAESYSLPNGLASPESFVFAETTDEKTAETAVVTCKPDINGSLGGRWFYLPNQKDFVYIKNTESNEVVSITCNNDIAGSLNSTYFVLPKQNYYVWLDVDSTGIDPATTALILSHMTGIKVDISANSSSNDIADAINTALEGNADVTSTVSENILAITSKTPGSILHGNSGTTGFTYQTTIIGIDASKDVTVSGAQGYAATISPNASATDVATAVSNAINTTTAFTATIPSDTTQVQITAIDTGFMLDAIDGDKPTNFVITTTNQGSSQSGSEALLFYSADPNSLNISFKIFSHQDHPEKAPLSDTFLVEVYKDGILETSITCSRRQDMMDGNGNLLYVENAMENSAYLRCRNNEAVDSTEIPASITTALQITGGTPGTNVTTGEMINAVQEWRNKDDFDVTVIMVGGWTDPAYTYELENIASTRGDCVVVNSIPYYIENTSDYLQNIINYRKNDLNMNSSYIATYSSNLEVYNSSLNKNVYVPSDGYIAGAIINASRNYEIFYPILGFKRGTLSNVLDVKHRYTIEEMDALYNVQINPIRFIPGRGIVVWGQKTMQSQPSSLDRLNARLLLCSLKPELQKFLETYIGELNTNQTRDKVTILLTGLFKKVQAKDGILDFEVSCDPIDANGPNKLTVTAKIQITPAIEYVDMTIVLSPIGVQFV